MRPLAFVGRHATAFMASGVLAGIAVPPIAALARPLLVPTLLIPLTLALVRLDWSAAAAWRRRPWIVAALLAWLLVASPVLVHAVASALVALGMPPTLRQALVLAAASSPIVSSVAIALIVGLDASLAIVAVLLATALVPLTLPSIALALLGTVVDFGGGGFVLRLAGFVAGAFGAAWIVRRLTPPAVLASGREWLDGLTVINLVLFGLAIMDGVTAYGFERPAFVAGATVAAFAFNLFLQAAGWLVFRRLGGRQAVTVALLSGNCNMGLVLVALPPEAPFEVRVFFALAQIPMYTLPAMLARGYRRAGATAAR
jgi:bile acid:Na+ symporter, BASS family